MLNAKPVPQNVEPEGLKECLDEMMDDNRISILYHATVVGATRVDNRITSVEIQERRGRRHLYARAFVDCSGDGDLAYQGGASTRYGNHGHVNLGSLATRFGGLHGANPTSKTWAGAVVAAKKKNPELQKLIPRNTGILIKLPQSGDFVTYLASAYYDARSSASITAAEKQGRRQAKIYLDILRTIPGHEKMHLVSTGPHFGTRESRHINSRRQLTRADILSGVKFDDTIALGAWYLEWHDGSKPDWPIRFVLPPGSIFEIPLGCLHSIDTENLYAGGRCADGDRDGGSAIRVMGTALATGQAAGVAASLLSVLGYPPPAAEVRRVLLEHGALLDPDQLPIIDEVDDPVGRNPTNVEVLGE